MDFEGYYGRHKTRSNYVRQEDVRQKSEKFSAWFDGELMQKINNLAKKLGQSKSKVTKDILEDFFLEQRLRDQKEDVEHFLKNT